MMRSVAPASSCRGILARTEVGHGDTGTEDVHKEGGISSDDRQALGLASLLSIGTAHWSFLRISRKWSEPKTTRTSPTKM